MLMGGNAHTKISNFNQDTKHLIRQIFYQRVEGEGGGETAGPGDRDGLVGGGIDMLRGWQ